MESLFYEIFEGMHRLGPGNDEATIRALGLTGLEGLELKILDIGCGTGAQTFILANKLKGKLIAIDNHAPFLEQIEKKLTQEETLASIKCVCMDMKHIVCHHESMDLVWAEGSIYIIGFKQGLQLIQPLLKKGGFAVFSDMNYLKPHPPRELVNFFRQECPDMITKEQNIELINASGFTLVHHFELGRKGHWESYYQPLQERVDSFAKKYKNQPEALKQGLYIQYEIDLYKKYADYYGYVFYVMQKPLE